MVTSYYVASLASSLAVAFPRDLRLSQESRCEPQSLAGSQLVESRRLLSVVQRSWPRTQWNYVTCVVLSDVQQGASTSKRYCSTAGS